MEHRFWNNRWERNEIGFHQTEINPFLSRYFPDLAVVEGATVFVPLCGKSRDLLWLRDNGYRVVGVELSELAVRAFFNENGIEPEIEPCGPFLRFSSDNLLLFCGDFFKLTTDMIGPVASVYDRASLVALPPQMRPGYAEHLSGLITAGTQVLTVSYTYDQEKMPGPPFAVTPREVRSLFEERFKVEQLISEAIVDLPERFRAAGLSDEISEEAYRLVRL